MFNSKVFLAEFIGTFALVFVGAGAGIAGAGLLGVALAHGLTLAVFAYTYGYISGTHVNPAVSFGLWANGSIKWQELLWYWFAQFTGAIFAAFVLKTIVGDISAGATVGTLTESAPVYAAILEAILTFFLVNSVLHNAVAGKSGQFAGLVIGLTLTISILVGGPLTGASLNPARTFGPAIFTGPSFANVYTWVIYFFGPLIGATLAALVFNFFNGETVEAEPVVEKPAPAKRPAPRKVTKK
jgi:MIP family channel proteins